MVCLPDDKENTSAKGASVMIEVVTLGLAVICMLAAGYVFFRPGHPTSSHLKLFYFLWTYYSAAIVIDWHTGAELVHPIIDLNSADYITYIAKPFYYNITLLLGVLLGYHLMSRRFDAKVPHDSMPLETALIRPVEYLIPAALLVIAITWQLTIGITDRGVLQNDYRENQEILWLFVLRRIILCYCLYLIYRGAGIWIVLLGLTYAAATGERTAAAAVVLFYSAKAQKPDRMPQKVILLGFVAFVLVLWKPIHAYFIRAIQEGNAVVGSNALDVQWKGISGTESMCSVAIIGHVITEERDLLWGESYVVTPLLMTLPRMLSRDQPSTLAERASVELVPTHHIRPVGVAYSATAEAYRNFGAVGPFLIGLIYGVVMRAVDARYGGILFFWFILINLRFLRSDFASIYKNWIVVTGVSFVVVLLLAAIVDRSSPLRKTGITK